MGRVSRRISLERLLLRGTCLNAEALDLLPSIILPRRGHRKPGHDWEAAPVADRGASRRTRWRNSSSWRRCCMWSAPVSPLKPRISHWPFWNWLRSLRPSGQSSVAQAINTKPRQVRSRGRGQSFRLATRGAASLVFARRTRRRTRIASVVLGLVGVVGGLDGGSGRSVLVADRS